MFGNPYQNYQRARDPVPVQTFTTLQLQEEIKSAYKCIQISALIWFLCNIGAGIWVYFNLQKFQPTLLIIDYVQMGYVAAVCLFIFSTGSMKTPGIVTAYVISLWIYLGYVVGRMGLIAYIQDGFFDDSFYALTILSTLFFPIIILIRSTEAQRHIKRAPAQHTVRL